ncbi:MAG: WD40 repeat domain-containing protein [Acidobacteriota bacterium]|nr:MAG: WD40 repeat domain-containing protein [Acidobacteriota bacterium]
MRDLIHTLISTTIALSLLALFGAADLSRTASAQDGAIPAQLVVQTGHNGYVNSVAYSPSGKTIASGSRDGTIKLWSPETGLELLTIKVGTGYPNAIRFSRDGKMIAAGGSTGELGLWDASNGAAILRLKADDEWIKSVGFSPDGRFLFSSSSGGKIFVWETATGKRVGELAGHSRSVSSLAISPDGSRLVSGGETGEVFLWSLADGTLERTLECQKYGVRAVAFSPDGRLVSCGGAGDGIDIRIWDAEEGTLNGEFPGHGMPVRALEFSPSGRSLASSGGDSVKLWDLDAMRESRTFEGHDNYADTVAFSPDGGQLVSGSWDKTVRIWDVRTGTLKRVLSGLVNQVLSYAIAPNGKYLAVGGETGLTVRDQTISHNTRQLAGHLRPVIALAFSPDSEVLASGSQDGSIGIWDIGTGSFRHRLTGHTDWVTSVAYSEEGKRLVSADKDGNVKVWDLESQTVASEFVHRKYSAVSVVFSPDGNKVASGGQDGVIKIWDLGSGNELSSFEITDGELGFVFTVRFSPDESRLVTESADRKVRIWNTGSGEMTEVLDIDEDKTVNTVIQICPRFFEFTKLKMIDPVTRLTYSPGVNGRLDLRRPGENGYLASLLLFLGNEWAVTTTGGLFDASPGGREMLHYVVGLETVTLEQMKEVYYVPGLLQKIFRGEPLPKVGLFTSKDLYPEVAFEFEEESRRLSVKLRNRGGGIGPVQVLVNSKEVVEDARPEGFDPGAREASLTVSLEGAPFLAGQENRIEVVARNREGSLTNKGTPKGSRSSKVSGDGDALSAPDVYAIVGGVSDYTGDDLDLRFAAKDAEDFAKAVELGALRLTGDPGKVHIRLLTSGGGSRGPGSRSRTRRRAALRRRSSGRRSMTSVERGRRTSSSCIFRATERRSA